MNLRKGSLPRQRWAVRSHASDVVGMPWVSELAPVPGVDPLSVQQKMPTKAQMLMLGLVVPISVRGIGDVDRKC